MTTSGPEMHRQLMDGYKDVQQRIEQMRSQIAGIDTQRGELHHDRSDSLLNLAEYYLPELTRDAIESSWVEVRSSMSQVLMRKEDQHRQLSDTLSEVNDKRYLQEDRLLEINTSLDEANVQQSELAEKVKNELAADQQFSSLSTQAAVAEAALERAESNLEQIEQEATRKLPAYEESSLFNYLRDQKFGTEDYTKRGFTRRMDRWLAKYIDYNKANQGYEFLVNTPDQMRRIIADDRKSLDTVMKELESQRDRVAKRLGLNAAVTKVDQLQQRREGVLAELDQIREQTDALEKQLTDLEDTRGSYYHEAVTQFRDMLAKIDTHDLASRARRTPSLTDDQIVASIKGVDQKLDDLDDHTRSYQDDLREMQRCVDAVGRLMQRFRAAKFDAARSQFQSSVDVIGDLHRATSDDDVEQLWDRIRRGQRWGPSLGEQLTSVATHPVTQVLVSAMAQAAGAAMSGHARRAGHRRYQNSGRRYQNRLIDSGDSSDDGSSDRRDRRR
ncbi:hypothetical protein NHH03_19045 [Stieleria sp. TO1_6]|uniref:coiled-coil domain-containing protein n=1 Tax=Stieleria tagensis TaxID=2956795 RepID=UPI00209B8CB5|nr:hypothetical protein [Stieleria tagensis]MCO8123850.1 hypothetical protein [Stieleria tagensis]